MRTSSGGHEHTVSTRMVEMAVALLFILTALVVISDSWRVGARWASDGPQAGYFPFYIGVIMLIASSVTFFKALTAGSTADDNFVERTQLKQVFQVLVPTIVFVAAIGLLGIYLAAAIFIAFFMMWLGRYRPVRVAPVAVFVPVALFFMFEVWFQVPLPKGPIETALGY